MATNITYELRTFADLVAAVREELKIQSTDTNTINRIKRDINIVYLQEVVPFSQWKWLRDYLTLTQFAAYTSGTAIFSNNSTAVTLSVAPGNSKKGFWISPIGYAEVFRVSQHDAGSTFLTLEAPYTGATVTAASFKIWTDKIPLPSFCRETIQLTHDYNDVPIENCGLQKYRAYVASLPKAEGRPLFSTTNTYVDPGKYAAVASLPSISFRASANLVKTLTFSSDVSSYFQAGDRIEVTKAGDYTYNGQLEVSSVSTTSLVYTGLYPLQESAIADSSLTIQKWQSPIDTRRYKELLVYPSIYSSNTEIHIDYLREVNPLVNDNDEPLIPISDRGVLLYGALAKAWSRERNESEGQRNYQLYQAKIERMAGKIDDSIDFPTLRVGKTYLGVKRSNQRYRDNYKGMPSGFGGASGSTSSSATGVPLRVAVFDSSGVLSSSPVTSTEESRLSGILSNAVGVSDSQTLTNKIINAPDNTITNIVNANISSGASIAYSKLNLTGDIVNADIATAAAIAYSKLAALPSADILVGSASNVATAVAVTGNVTISNAGVTTIGATQVTNGMLAGSIAASKLVGTDITTVGTVTAGTWSATAIANTKGGTGGDSSASTGVAKVAAGSWSYSTIVNADVSASAAIAISKLGNQVVQSKTANYAVLSTDDLLVAPSGTFTFTLPAVSTSQIKPYKFKNNGTGVITIARVGSDTIDALTSLVLGAKFDEVVLVPDGGTNWNIVSNGITAAARGTDTAGTAVANSSDVKIPAGTISFDPQSALASTGIYTVQIPGKYQVNAAASFQSFSVAQTRIIIKIRKNSTAVANSSAITQGAGVVWSPPAISDILLCAAGDTIDAVVNQNSGGSQTLTTTAGDNYLSIVRIGN